MKKFFQKKLFLSMGYWALAFCGFFLLFIGVGHFLKKNEGDTEMRSHEKIKSIGR